MSDETRPITWDDSAALFNATGRYVLQEELKGDGIFTLYFLDADVPTLNRFIAGELKRWTAFFQDSGLKPQ